jgi:hypothetical protein
MKPYESWKNIVETDMSEEQYARFWKEYLKKEENIYKQLLPQDNGISGNIQTLAKLFGVEELTFTGFLDGINTSLTESLDLEALELDTDLVLDLDYEKLYFNMHDAKAKWLYSIKDWDRLLTQEQRKEIKSAYRQSVMAVKKVKIGRNDPCPCGSGKKYKKCCMLKDEAEIISPQ